MNSDNISQKKLLWISRLIIVIYFSLIASGILRFQIWSQIWDFHLKSDQASYEPTDLYIHYFTHTHLLRYLLIHPIISLGNLINVDPNLIFSVCVAILVVFFSWNTTKSTVLLIEKPYLFRPFFIFNLATIIFISYFMNGRLMWALAGLSCIQLILLQINQNHARSIWILPITLISLFFCSVSTGVFNLAVLVVYSWLALYFLKAFGQKFFSLYDIALGLLLLLILYFLYPLVYLYISANINYYGGGLTGFFEMRNHGAGKIIKEAGVMKTIGIIISLVSYACVFSYSWMRYKQTRFLLTIITLCGGLGIFGYSILAMAIPSSLCLLNIAIYNFASDKFTSKPLAMKH